MTLTLSTELSALRGDRSSLQEQVAKLESELAGTTEKKLELELQLQFEHAQAKEAAETAALTAEAAAAAAAAVSNNSAAALDPQKQQLKEEEEQLKEGQLKQQLVDAEKEA